MLASDVLDKASIQLLDEDNDRWPVPELIDYLNLAQRELVKYKPAASKLRTTIALTADQTEQALPSDGLMLIDVDRNIKADDSAGKAIHYADRDSLDRFNPSWHSDDSQVQTDNWLYESDVDPLVFWITPPVSTGAQAEIVYSRLPTEVTAVGDTLTLSDDYEGPLVDYVVSRAFAKDSETQDMAKAQQYFASFAQSIGMRISAQAKQRADAEGGK